MNKFFLLLILSATLSAQTIHSSLSTYYENKTFTNSVQKEDGVVYGFGADIHYGGSEFKVTYEQAKTNTIGQTNIKKGDLEIKKIYMRYAYNFDKKFALNINYLSVLEDNIAPTDGGFAFGGGMTYTFNRKLALNFTQYYTEYEDFDIFQSDFRVDYKMKVDKVKLKFSSITKFISVEDDDAVEHYTDNAQNTYLTTGVKFHAHAKGYHLGLGAYFGKRAFAIMDDGFKIQHHAMEFDRTYAVGIGKNFYDFVLRGQYVYQRAVELPVNNNQNVKVSVYRVVANYKF